MSLSPVLVGSARPNASGFSKDGVVPDAKRRGKLRPCKDMNEIKQHLGVDKVREIIKNAKPWPEAW